MFTGTLAEVRDTRPVGRVPTAAGELVSVGPGVIVYAFAVESVAKGLIGPRVDVVQGGSNCDFLFERGKRYVVFGQRGPEGLGTSMCSPTGLADGHPWVRALPWRPVALQWLPTLQAAAVAVFTVAGPPLRRRPARPGG